MQSVHQDLAGLLVRGTAQARAVGESTIGEARHPPAEVRVSSLCVNHWNTEYVVLCPKLPPRNTARSANRTTLARIRDFKSSSPVPSSVIPEVTESTKQVWNQIVISDELRNVLYVPREPSEAWGKDEELSTHHPFGA